MRMDESQLDTLFGSSMPGADEGAALDLFGLYMDEWDRIVFDTAPTGHTLRLLDLPETVGSAVQTAAGIRKKAKKTADRVKTVVLGPFAFRGEDEADEAFQDLQERMERVTEVLRDPQLTNFRVVFRPEAMVLSETERLVGRLREADVEVADLVTNGVLVDVNEDCDRCLRQRDRHHERLDTVRETFELPLTEVPEMDEPSGVETLEQVGESLLRDREGARWSVRLPVQAVEQFRVGPELQHVVDHAVADVGDDAAVFLVAVVDPLRLGPPGREHHHRLPLVLPVREEVE